MSSDDPPQDRLSREERSSDGLTIAVPQLLSAKSATRRSAQCPRERQRESVVQPEHQGCTRPKCIANRSVVANDDPAAARGALQNALPKALRSRGLPARLPVQRVKLDDGQIGLEGQCAGKHRLAGAAVSYNENPLGVRRLRHQGCSICVPVLAGWRKILQKGTARRSQASSDSAASRRACARSVRTKPLASWGQA